MLEALNESPNEEQQDCAEINFFFPSCTTEACLRISLLLVSSCYPFYNFIIRNRLNACTWITYIACVFLLFSIAAQTGLTHISKLCSKCRDLTIVCIIFALTVTNSILWAIHFAPEENHCESIRSLKLRKVCSSSFVCFLRASMFILLNLALLLKAIGISDDDANIINLNMDDPDVQNTVSEIRRHTYRLRKKSNNLTGLWWLVFLLIWVCLRIAAFYINALDAYNRRDYLCFAFWSTDIMQTALGLVILQKLGEVGERCREKVCLYEDKYEVFIKEKDEIGYYIYIPLFNSFIIRPSMWASAFFLPILFNYIWKLCSEWPI